MTWYMGIDNMKVTDSLSLSLSLSLSQAPFFGGLTGNMEINIMKVSEIIYFN
jgi:hypothetical protein